MTEQYTMLSELQMRVRKNCFFETMLNLLVNQMHAVKKKKLYDLLAFIKYYRCFWLSCKQLSSACSSHEKDFSEACKMSVHLHDKLHHYIDAFRYWNREKHSNSRNFSKLITFTDFIFFLHCRTVRFLQ